MVVLGMYFEKASSSADGTIISLNTIFSSNFQVAHTSKYQKIVLNKNNLIDIFKKNGYHVYGIFPNFTSFNSLRECFENENNSYDWIKPNIPPVTLSTGLATKIIQLLESKKQEPCFYYFHIFDLHPLREGRKPLGIKNFDNEKFGSSPYERTVSAIDFWLGKILEHVDLDNTILILTSDHGERIPYGGLRNVF
jgi:glucan phosphoethanolaminetransferase (alkaline phosphatase superfamily)